MRFQDWPLRLHNRIKALHAIPFEWGKHDCCLFAADMILELTGVDHAAGLRGIYSTAPEAARILKERGGVRGIASAALGDEIHPNLAQRGDIVLVQTEDHGDTLAVCICSLCAAPGLDRLQYLPMSAAITAWRVA